MTEPTGTPPPRLRDNQVGNALSRLNDLLREVEQTPGPAGEVALDAVSALARVYGEALARAIGHVAGTPAVREAFLNDELLGHLLVLHDLHPESPDCRVSRVVAKLSGPLVDRGGRIELAGIHDAVATVRLSAHGYGSARIAAAVREAVIAAAPVLSDVSVVSTGTHDSMDTRLCDAVHALADGVDILVIEASFLTEDSEPANRYGHLTARQAARVAVECGVRGLVLTHFSQRYADANRYLDEAADVYTGDLVIAEDLARIPLLERK